MLNFRVTPTQVQVRIGSWVVNPADTFGFLEALRREAPEIEQRENSCR